MKKEKKSLTSLVAIAILVTMIALVIISGTYAKYTAELDGEGTAIVAKWDVNFKDLEGNELTEDTEFDLFAKSAVYDFEGLTAATDLSTVTPALEATTDVYQATEGTTRVAPGTWGKVGFKVVVSEDNEVKVRYGIDITSLSCALPLEFSADGSTWVKAEDITASAETPYVLLQDTVNAKTAETNTAVLYWRWIFEDGTEETDEADTALGTDGTATCSITAKLGATQVD